eukprot:jgi/Galph1/3241/GphlegSOOS_G1886.1
MATWKKKVDLDSDIWEDVNTNALSSKEGWQVNKSSVDFSSETASHGESDGQEVVAGKEKQMADSSEREYATSEGGPLVKLTEEESTVTPDMEKLQSLPSASNEAAAKSYESLVQVQGLQEVNRQLSKRLEEESDRASLAEKRRVELATKVSSLEKKLAALVKERESLKKDRGSKSLDAELLKEKDAQIEQILQEGEQLSKKISDKEQHVKKLRAKIQELEKERDGLKNRVQELEAKVQKMTTQYSLLETEQKSLQTQLKEKEQLLKQTMENSKKVAETEDTVRSLTEELQETKKKYQQELENKEKEWRQQAEQLLASVSKEANRKHSSLEQEVELLRSEIEEVLSNSAAREEEWSKQVEEYRQRCRDLEERLQNYVLESPYRDESLSRRIEDLQSHYIEQLRLCKVVENSLYEKLKAADSRVENLTTELDDWKYKANVSSVERERLEKLVAGKEDENNKLQEQYENVNAELEDLKRDSSECRQYLEQLVEQYKREIEEVKSALYSERQRRHSQHEKRSKDSFRDVGVQTMERDVERLNKNGESSDRKFDLNVDRKAVSMRTSDALNELEKMTFDAYSFERLKFLVRQVVGDIELVSDALMHREEEQRWTQERLLEYEDKLKSFEQLESVQTALEELKVRYNATLEILGEREERVQELEADIADLKSAYQDQVNYLLSKLRE